MDAAFLLDGHSGSGHRAVFRLAGLTREQASLFLSTMKRITPHGELRLSMVWDNELDAPTVLEYERQVEKTRVAAQPNWIEHRNDRPLQALLADAESILAKVRQRSRDAASIPVVIGEAAQAIDQRYASDFHNLAEGFDGLYAGAMTLPQADVEREYRSVAAQGGRLARAAGIDQSKLWYPIRGTDGKFAGQQIAPDPTNPISVVIPPTGIRTDDFLSRVWGNLVNGIADSQPARFPDPTTDWEPTDSGVMRSIDVNADRRPAIRREARASAIAARIIADRLEATEPNEDSAEPAAVHRLGAGHDANPPSRKAGKEHPALALFHALNALHTVCSNAHLFQELAEQRKRASEMRLKDLNVVAKVASDRANERARRGASVRDVFAAFEDLEKAKSELPRPAEPPGYAEQLSQTVLEPGRECCARARDALRAGGAQGLDRATHPNAAGQARSIELHTKLQDAERVFVGLTMGLGNTRTVIDKDAESMATLGEYFGRVRDEMGAVFETRGLDASPGPSGEDAGEGTVAGAATRLGRVRDALFSASRKAHRLATATERLEAAYAGESPVNPDDFYVASTMQTGEALEDPDWQDTAPPGKHRVRRNAIDAVLALRAAVDAAITEVPGIADLMDSLQESVDRRWTTRMIGQLRVLRGAILRGHGLDACPSAMPMIRAGVPEAVRKAAQSIAERMEEVKSAILAGVQPRVAPTTVAPELLARLEAVAAAADPGAVDRVGARDDDYRPASWFPKGMAPRLRMAAGKDRKTKRVRTQLIDGVVCYSVVDARRWWSEDVPKQA